MLPTERVELVELAALVELLRAQLGHAPTRVVSLRGGYSHPTVRAQLEPFGDVVIKAATATAKRAELRREARVLALRIVSVPMPRLHASFDADGWTVEILGALPGVNGLDLLGDALALPAAYGALARVLATVHTRTRALADAPCDNAVLLRAIDLKDRAHAVAHDLPALALTGPQHSVLLTAMEIANGLITDPCLVHGDAGLHNILWDNGQLSGLLDWEWASWGNPQLDLAWLRWTLHWRRVDDLWPIALAAYQSAGGPARAPSPVEFRALALSQIGMILVRSVGHEAAAAEWRRRLDWTLAALD